MPSYIPGQLSRAEIRTLLHAPFEALAAMADAVRRDRVGDRVWVRGIIEFSNRCICHCRYCGLRCENTSLKRYILEKDVLFAAAQTAAEAGVDTFVLQSGEFPGCSAEFLAGIVAELRSRYPELAITLSVGERTPDTYALWREAGAERFLIKHETANPALYARLHPGRTLYARLEALRTLRALGYRVGSGFIIDVPGQTEDDLIEDLMLVQTLRPDMCGAGPFLPQAETPLGREPHGSVDRTLRVMALLRLVLPEGWIPATTALASLDPEQGQLRGLLAGCNVLMPSFTPSEARSSYCIYDHKQRVNMQEAQRVIAAAGRRFVAVRQTACAQADACSSGTGA